MKIASTFLHDLVHSLTKSEKRYIKVQSGSGEKDYLQLMDALTAQKKFDEDQLTKDHAGANFLKHLAVSKQYLYELLLKSLARFGQKTLEDKVYEKITAANVLMAKGLNAAAFKEVRKGQKLAEKYELFELKIMLCAIEKRLLSQRQFKTKGKKENIHQIFRLEKDSLEQLSNTNAYWYLTQQIVQFQLQFQKIQTKEQKDYIESLMESPQFQDVCLATNFKSKLYYYQANATYQFMLGNVKKAYEINRSFLDLLDAHPHFLKLYAERYLATLNNMLIDSFIIGEYKVLEEGINRLAQIAKRSEFKSIKNIASRVFRQRYLLLINWTLSKKSPLERGMLGKPLEWIPEIEAGLHRFGKKIEKHHRITFYYLIAYLLFQNERFDESLQWNNRILNEPKEDVVKEIFYFARTFNLLIHYELENHVLLESLLSSTPKYLKSRRSIYATEKALFRFLGKLLNHANKTERQELLTDFKNTIHELYQRSSERRVFSYLDLRLWVEKM